MNGYPTLFRVGKAKWGEEKEWDLISFSHTSWICNTHFPNNQYGLWDNTYILPPSHNCSPL